MVDMVSHNLQHNLIQLLESAVGRYTYKVLNRSIIGLLAVNCDVINPSSRMIRFSLEWKDIVYVKD